MVFNFDDFLLGSAQSILGAVAGAYVSNRGASKRQELEHGHQTGATNQNLIAEGRERDRLIGEESKKAIAAARNRTLAGGIKEGTFKSAYSMVEQAQKKKVVTDITNRFAGGSAAVWGPPSKKSSKKMKKWKQENYYDNKEATEQRVDEYIRGVLDYGAGWNKRQKNLYGIE